MKKINAEWTTEMVNDLKNHHGLENNIIYMLHYEYEIKNEKELLLLKEHTEIDFVEENIIFFSLTKKQLRNIKLKSIEGVREFSILKKIIFNSKISNITDILEKRLSNSNELSNEINKKILKKVIKLGN